MTVYPHHRWDPYNQSIVPTSGPSRVTNEEDPEFVPKPFLGLAPKPVVEPDTWEGDQA